MSLSKKEAKTIAANCFHDPIQFCNTFFPHIFPEEIPWVHRGILALFLNKTDFLDEYGELDKIKNNFVWDDGTHVFTDNMEITQWYKNILVLLPQGFSKTSYIGLVIPIYNMLYLEAMLAVYIGDSPKGARKQLAIIKSELETNGRIRAVFGSMKPTWDENRPWSGDFLETNTGIALATRGYGADTTIRVKGITHAGMKPARLYFDDIENMDSLSTPEQRRKVREWFQSEVLGSISLIDTKARTLGLSTLHHPESFLEFLARDDTFKVLRFQVIDRNGDPLWPLIMDKRAIDAKRSSYATIGQLHKFQMMYYNEPHSEQGDVIVKEQDLLLESLIDDIQRAHERTAGVLGNNPTLPPDGLDLGHLQSTTETPQGVEQ